MFFSWLSSKSYQLSPRNCLQMISPHSTAGASFFSWQQVKFYSSHYYTRYICVCMHLFFNPLIMSVCFTLSNSQWRVDTIMLISGLRLSKPHVIRLFWSTYFCCRLPVKPSSSEEINNSLTSVGWDGANVRTLYLHMQRSPSDLLFWHFNKQFGLSRKSYSIGVIFCGQTAKPELIRYCVIQCIHCNMKLTIQQNNK